MPKTTCSIQNCAKPSRARGWCWPHYQHWRRNGDANYVAPTEAERFWSFVDRTESCWNWTGGKSRLGYGTFFARGGERLAYRYSFSMHAGREIERGMDIDHICRNPRCVRPDHLREATRKQNKENHGGAQVNSKTGIRGVYFDKQRQGYLAVVGHNGRRICLGKFETAEAAGKAAKEVRLELFTHNDADRD